MLLNSSHSYVSCYFFKYSQLLLLWTPKGGDLESKVARVLNREGEK